MSEIPNDWQPDVVATWFRHPGYDYYCTENRCRRVFSNRKNAYEHMVKTNHVIGIVKVRGQ